MIRPFSKQSECKPHNSKVHPGVKHAKVFGMAGKALYKETNTENTERKYELSSIISEGDMNKKSWKKTYEKKRYRRELFNRCSNPLLAKWIYDEAIEEYRQGSDNRFGLKGWSTIPQTIAIAKFCHTSKNTLSKTLREMVGVGLLRRRAVPRSKIGGSIRQGERLIPATFKYVYKRTPLILIAPRSPGTVRQEDKPPIEADNQSESLEGFENPQWFAKT